MCLPFSPVGIPTVYALHLELRVLSHPILFPFPFLLVYTLRHLGKGKFFARFLGFAWRKAPWTPTKQRPLSWKERRQLFFWVLAARCRALEVRNAVRLEKVNSSGVRRVLGYSCLWSVWGMSARAVFLANEAKFKRRCRGGVIISYREWSCLSLIRFPNIIAFCGFWSVVFYSNWWRKG